MAPKVRISTVSKSENKQLFSELEARKQLIAKKFTGKVQRKPKNVQTKPKKVLNKQTKEKLKSYEANTDSFKLYRYKRSVDIDQLYKVGQYKRPQESRVTTLEEKAQFLRIQIDAINNKLYKCDVTQSRSEALKRPE